jgi:hypothetical protein
MRLVPDVEHHAPDALVAALLDQATIGNVQSIAAHPRRSPSSSASLMRSLTSSRSRKLDRDPPEAGASPASRRRSPRASRAARRSPHVGRIERNDVQPVARRNLDQTFCCNRSRASLSGVRLHRKSRGDLGFRGREARRISVVENASFNCR